MLRSQRVARVEEQHGGSDGTGGLGAEAVVNGLRWFPSLVEYDHTDEEERTHPEREHDRLPACLGFGPAAGFPSHAVSSA